MSTRVHRLFLLSGIAFVAIAVGGTIAFGANTPDTSASAEELASFYGDHTVSQGFTAFALAASAPFLVLFGIGLAGALSPADGAMSAWAYVVIVGTALAAGAVLVTAFVHFALSNGADEEVAPVALQALNSLDGNTWMVFNPAFGVMMLGAAGALLSAEAMRWLGWTALVLAIALFVPFADFFALLLTLVWIVVASVALSRRRTEAAYVAAPGAA